MTLLPFRIPACLLFAFPLFAAVSAVAQDVDPDDPAYLPTAAEEILADGDEAMDAGNFETARSHYYRLLDEHPEHPVALGRIAATHRWERTPNQCIHYAELSARPKSAFRPVALGTLGYCLEMAGSGDRALEAFEEALAETGDDRTLRAELYEGKARIHYGMDEIDHVYTALFDGIEADPTYANAHRVLAQLLGHHGLPLHAFLARSFSLMLDPQSPQADEALEALYASLHLQDNGEVEFNHVLALYDAYFSEFTDQEVAEDANDPVGNLYMPFFRDLHAAGHTEAFAYFTWQSSGLDGVDTWIADNEQAILDFLDWAEDWIFD